MNDNKKSKKYSFDEWCKDTIPKVEDLIKKVKAMSEPYILCDLELHRIDKEGKCMVCDIDLIDKNP